MACLYLLNETAVVVLLLLEYLAEQLGNPGSQLSPRDPLVTLQNESAQPRILGFSEGTVESPETLVEFLEVYLARVVLVNV